VRVLREVERAHSWVVMRDQQKAELLRRGEAAADHDEQQHD